MPLPATVSILEFEGFGAIGAPRPSPTGGHFHASICNHVRISLLRLLAWPQFALLAIVVIAVQLHDSFARRPARRRQLAPGVLTTIEPSLEPDDTVSTHDIMEIRANPALQWNPEFLAATETLVGMADKVKFRREIYCLEFSFKPLRMIEVDVPIASGGTRAQAGLVPRLPRSQHGPGAEAGRRARTACTRPNPPRAARCDFCRSSFWNRRIARPTASGLSNRTWIA